MIRIAVTQAALAAIAATLPLGSVVATMIMTMIIRNRL